MKNRDFHSLWEFLVFVDTLSIRTLVADVQGRSIVSQSLKVAVRDRIGDADRLPPPLAESTVQERVAKGFTPDDTLLRTGELKRSIGWAHEGQTVSIVGSRDPKAMYHELGTAHIPRRSFLAATADEKNQEMFEKYLAAFVASFVSGTSTTIAMSEAEAL